jgi:hypothetical protein
MFAGTVYGKLLIVALKSLADNNVASSGKYRLAGTRLMTTLAVADRCCYRVRDGAKLDSRIRGV